MMKWDGFLDDRLVRNMIKSFSQRETHRGDAAAGIILILGHGLNNLPLFHDLAPLVKESWPEVFGKFYARGNDFSRAEVDSRLADKSYQLYTRQLLWGELGYVIDNAGNARPDPQGRAVVKPTVSIPSWENRKDDYPTAHRPGQNAMNQPTWGGMTAEEMSYNIWRGSTRTGEVCFPRWKDLSPRQRKSWAEALTAGAPLGHR